MAEWESGRGRERVELVATVAFILLCVVGIVLGVATIWARATGPATRTGAGALPPRPTTRPTPATPPLPTEPIDMASATTLGKRDATVAVIEYSDFKCPYCGVFARETWPALKSQYVDTGRIRFVFRQLPLDRLHPFARQAAQTAVCADGQAKFWPLHDLMFANQAPLDEAELAKHIKAAGLDAKRLSACLASDAARRVDADEATGRLLGVTGTPTFFIGLVQPDGRVLLKQRLAGAQPLGPFETALGRWLSEAGDKVK